MFGLQSDMAGASRLDDESIPGLRRTVWDQDKLKVEYKKLEQDMTTDVVVIGGGIAGLNIAYNLVKEGKDVVVLESRVIGV
jgi:heterodisulfide reductase subunit A-like polyferredoxin